MLFGKLGAQKGTVRDVEIVDVVEVTHGGHIEVSFDDKDYVAFAEINERYAAEGVFNVGWYHSHPGLTVFLSTVDVRNHLGFQTTNPSAIAIVWDHMLLEEDGHIGFETFRLTELGKGQYSDYATVKTKVEAPTTLDYYKLCIKEILDLQLGGNPPMFELNELPTVVGDFEPTPIEDSKFIPPSFPSMLSNNNSAKIGSSDLSSSAIGAFATIMNNWAQDFSQALKNKGVVLNQNTGALKESIEKQIKNLQLWFLNKANDVFLDVWEKVDTGIEDRLNLLKNCLGEIDSGLPLDDIQLKMVDSDLKAIISEFLTLRKQAQEKVPQLKLKS